MKQFFKKILRSSLSYRLICFLGAVVIYLMYHTSRWTVYGIDSPQAFWKNKKPFIMAFWHGRLLMVPHAWNRNKRIHILMSGHRDGQLIGRTVSYFGIESIRGSKSKGGAAALRQMIETLKQGETVGITPDGPRGPHMTVSEGVIRLAQLTQTPILVLTYSVKHGRHLKSWDKFLVPRLFTKGIYLWSTPFYVKPEDDVKERTQTLQKKMIALTNRADQLLGRETP